MFAAIKKLFSAAPDLTVARTPGRNEPCHCGSGKKYKGCCLVKEQRKGHR